MGWRRQAVANVCALICAALGVGCGPRVLYEVADETGSAEDASTDPDPEGSTGEPGESESESGTLDGCPPPGPTAVMDLVVEFAGSELGDEGGSVERRAWCTVAGGAGGPGHTELHLSCDEVDGEQGVAYRISIASPEDPIGSWLDWGGTIDLEYRKRYHWEAGGGQSLRLAQDAVTHLVAHDEHSGGGLADTCSSGFDDAEDWLSRFPALLETDTCGDGSSMRLHAFTLEGDRLAYPGTWGVLGGSVSYVFESGRCDYGNTWQFAAMLWR